MNGYISNVPTLSSNKSAQIFGQKKQLVNASQTVKEFKLLNTIILN